MNKSSDTTKSAHSLRAAISEILYSLDKKLMQLEDDELLQNDVLKINCTDTPGIILNILIDHQKFFSNDNIQRSRGPQGSNGSRTV